MKNNLTSLSDLAAAFGKTPIKSENIVTNNDTLVYSTDKGRISASKQKVVTPSDGFARVRRETKGRKGKGVMVIAGLGLDSNALKELATQLKKTCGTGGSVVSETIEIQGDNREVIKQVLEKKGFKVKFVGG
jgi:translation initiation factor 1